MEKKEDEIEVWNEYGQIVKYRINAIETGIISGFIISYFESINLAVTIIRW